jgi:hypothetical protein
MSTIKEENYIYEDTVCIIIKGVNADADGNIIHKKKDQ